AVHEARLSALTPAPGFQHAAHMPVDAGADLHRKAGRRSEDANIPDLMGPPLREQLGIAMVAEGADGGWRALPVAGQRRHPDDLPRLTARIRLRARAIHAHLPRAQQPLKLYETQAGIMGLEPAIEPHARRAAIHLDLLDAC